MSNRSDNHPSNEQPAPAAIRRSIRTRVRRIGAAHYLMVVLISFALTIAITRLFLELTGSPMIAPGELHIAHVLWGGLLMFIGGLLPLIYANRPILDTSALLTGIGMGLFMDELGKFITLNNDYRYPSAAPIIYVFFLLLVMLFLQIRNPPPADSRTALYAVLQDLQEVLDHDLSLRERDEMLSRLRAIPSSTDPPEILSLRRSLQAFLESREVILVDHKPGRLERLNAAFRAWEQRALTRARARLAIIAGLVALGLWSLSMPVYIAFIAGTPRLEQIFLGLISGRYVRGTLGLVTYQINLALQAATGLILILAAVLFILHKDRRAVNLSYLVLMLSLTLVNLLVFYFDQFSTILSASIQLLLFLMVVYYRQRYLNDPSQPRRAPE